MSDGQLPAKYSAPNSLLEVSGLTQYKRTIGSCVRRFRSKPILMVVAQVVLSRNVAGQQSLEDNIQEVNYRTRMVWITISRLVLLWRYSLNL